MLMPLSEKGNFSMILLYNMQDHPILAFLTPFTAMFGESLRHVSKEEYALPLGCLCYGDHYVPDENAAKPMPSPLASLPKAIDEPMLVFAGMPQEKVMMLLDFIKVQNVPSIPLKAVMTPTNQHWSYYLLYAHLLEEHRYYQSKANQ